MSLMDVPVEIRNMVFGYYLHIPWKCEFRDKLDFRPIDTGVTIIDLDEAHTKHSTALKLRPGHRQDEADAECAVAGTTSSTDMDNEEALRQVTTTRRSLLLTCKSIHHEWSPLFWSSTTVVLGRTQHQGPAAFERLFLAHIDDAKRCAIRHVVYCPLRWRTNPPGLANRPALTPHDCDDRGVLALRRILQAYPMLRERLQTLTLSFQPPFRHVPRKYWLREDEGQTVRDKWSAMDWRREWEALTDVLIKEDGAAAWRIQRVVGFKEVDFFSGGTYTWATTWTLVCHRLVPVVDQTPGESATEDDEN